MGLRTVSRFVVRRPRTTLAIVFLASRIVFYACGVRFDATWLTDMWQLVDPRLLETRLAESLYHLHTQPPLFNAFVGIMLKVGGDHHAALAAAIYRVLGLALVLMLLEVMLRCGVRTGLALLLAALFAINPGTVAMENILFYEFFTAVAVAASIIALERFVTTSAARWCIAFFG